MNFRLALAVIAAAICYVKPAAAQIWYWCDPAGAYYPYVATCPVPWRAVNPAMLLPQPYAPPPQTSAPARSVPAPDATVESKPAVAAADARCNAPPYGGSVAAYKAFVESFNQYVVPDICNAKYSSGEPRRALYNLGFTNEEINKMDTVDLAAKALVGLKNWVDKVR
jgi:hypothetical protein